MAQVINGNDSGPGSLRDAIENGSDTTITISSAVDLIQLTSLLTITRDVQITSEAVTTITSTSPTTYAILATDISQVGFENITFLGQSTGPAYLIQCARTYLTFNFCTVTSWGSVTPLPVGSVIDLLDCSLNIFFSTIEENTGQYIIQHACEAGGLMLMINDSTFRANAAQNGAIVRSFGREEIGSPALGINVSISSCNFIANNYTIVTPTAPALLHFVYDVPNSAAGIIIGNSIFEDNVITATASNIIYVSGGRFGLFSATGSRFAGNIITGGSVLYVSRRTDPGSQASVSISLERLLVNCSNANTKGLFLLSNEMSSLPTTVTIIDSVVYDAGLDGITIGGTAMTSSLTNVTVHNCDIGVLLPASASTCEMRNCTLCNNRNDGGATVPSTVTLYNTLIAQNFRDFVGFVAGGANNLIGDGTLLTGLVNGVNGNQVGTQASPIDPLFGTFGFYGGANNLPVMPLLEGSPAIDAGSNTYVDTTYDQRGAPMLREWSAVTPYTVDIGAFEFQPFLIPCLDGESLVKVRTKQSLEISVIPIKDVKAREHDVFATLKQEFIPIASNAVIRGATTIYQIPKAMIGATQDLRITSGHFIHFDGEPIKARDVPGAKRLIVPKISIYSIVSEEWEPIEINGIGVYTWSQRKWNDLVRREGIIWTEN